MKKNCILKIILILNILLLIFSFKIVFAQTNLEEIIKKDEYSNEYKNWLELDDEQKRKVIRPRMYDIENQQTNEGYLKTLPNMFKRSQLLKANLLNKFDLRTQIADNLEIKNQMETNECWAFATIGTLESHLALKDKLASKPVTLYDYSEKHMAYATSRSMFNNDQINEKGFTKTIEDGGYFAIAQAYLTNGSGAVTEQDLPFENIQEPIDISEIQNKNVVTTLVDTVEFEKPTTDIQRQEVIAKMKEHITNYGGIYASVYGADLLSDYYNNETGASYYKESELTKADHAVTIIGWDDTYKKEYFNEKNRPTNNGAWIVKNSWGEEGRYTLQELKENAYQQLKNEFDSMGYDSPEKIPDQFILTKYKETYGESKVQLQDDEVVIEIGDKGYMYISYEDARIYDTLYGVEKAVPYKDYDSIYQNDVLGISAQCTVSIDEPVYIANVFKRDSSKKEKLDKISVYTLQGYTCEVYVNPNGSGKSLNDLQEVKLVAGESESFNAGYHTIEFAEPIELTGETFTVAIKILNSANDKNIALESKNGDPFYENAVVNEGESFFSIESAIQDNQWQDFATVSNATLRGNVCIKAFTKEIKEQEEKEITKIEISNLPNKREYIQNKENLDLSGGKIKIIYEDGSSKVIDMNDNEVEVSGFDNKQLGDKTITVTYKDKTVTFTVKIKSEQTQEAKKPTLSNFSNSKANITNAEHYFFSENIDNSYSKVKIKVSNIKIGNKDNAYTYYYYLSGTEGDKDIELNSWQKCIAQKESDGTYSIIINIDTRKIENYNEILESDNLYIYVKEIAEIDNKKEEKIHTFPVENNDDSEIFYLDGEKLGSVEEVFEEMNKNKPTTTTQEKPAVSPDTTTAPITIPQTGIVSITIIAILIILLIGGYSYYRYKNIDR